MCPMRPFGRECHENVPAFALQPPSACRSNNHFVLPCIELEDSQEGDVEEGIIPEEIIRPILPILVHDELRATIALKAAGMRPRVEDVALRWIRWPDLIEALLSLEVVCDTLGLDVNPEVGSVGCCLV